MKRPAVSSNYAAARDEGRDSTELLLLPDGRILVHNLTPAVAALLAELSPDDSEMRRRSSLPPPSSPLPATLPIPPP